MDKLSYLNLKSGNIAYRQSQGTSPGVIFLGGFRSDMTGMKSEALADYCRKRGQAFLRFDYRGHGESSGAFEDGTIGMWKEDALSVLTRLTKGPQILIGSSMGGWLALLLAMEKPRRVAGILGIAAAADFTGALMWERFSAAQQEEILSEGKVMVPSDVGEPYPITKQLIEESQEHYILQDEIPVFCPVRLLHGMKDETVPWEVSLAINEKLAGQDVKTILLENADHRMNDAKHIGKILSVLGKMVDGLSQDA